MNKLLPQTTPGALVAHRGASFDAPENTLLAYELAATLGFSWIEVDCQLTRDHVPVMMHDSKLDRTTNGSGFVIDMPFKDLRHLDASGTHSRTERVKIPTLQETIELVNARQMGLVLEIKPIWGRDLEHARVVVQTVRDHWRAGFDRLVISSFSALCLQEVRRLLPEAPLALACEVVPEKPQDYVDLLGICGIHVQYKALTPEAVASVLATGAHISAATINDPEAARRIFRMGVPSVMTDSALLLPLEAA